MNDIQPIIDALQAKLPWLAALTTAMGLLRLVAKPLSALVQSFFTKLLLYVQGTPETDDNAWVEKILASKSYRAFAFVVDWVLSIKLPTSASVQKVQTSEATVSGPLPLLLLGALSLGLMTSGCRSLAPGGAYQGDQVLYQAETTIVTSYEIVDTFLKWERTNQKLLAKWPDIHRAADRLRADYPQWYRTANALRDAYAANPDPATRDKLQTALALLRTALTEATGYMAQTTTPN